MKYFQQAVCKNNTRQYPVYIKFQYEHVLKVWCCNSNLPLPGQVRFFSFPFVHPFWTHDWKRIYILTPWSFFTEFSSALQFEQTSQSLALKRWMHFLWLQVFFFIIIFYWVKLKICSSEFYQFYILEKPRIILVCRSDALLMDSAALNVCIT